MIRSLTAFCIINLLTYTYGLSQHERLKRFVVYPRGGSFKIVIGIGTPVKLGSKQSMAVGWNLQMQYAVPTNSTQLVSYPPDYTGKRSIEAPLSDRAMFYRAFEELLNNENFHGRSCLLRSICDNAAYSLDHKANGLYGKIFNIIFTPDYGKGDSTEDLDPIYLEAQQAGQFGAKCETLYNDCELKNGFLDLFSVLDF